MHPVTDIVVLTHNKIDITKGFIDQLYKHTEKSAFNLIFVDNNSTDGTVDFLKENQDKLNWSVYYSKENLGIIKGRNLGASLVKSDFFLNIDNDQYPGKNWLNELHALMNVGYDVVGCEAWLLSPPNSKKEIILQNQKFKDYFPYRKAVNKTDYFSYIGCGGMLIKKSVYDSIGLFDDLFSPAYFEDPDFSFRCIKSGYKLGWCYKCNITHLAHQTMNSQKLFQKNDQFIRSLKNFQKKWFPYYPDPVRMA